MSNRRAALGQSLGTGQGMTSSLVADATGKREGEGALPKGIGAEYRNCECG